MALPTRKAVLLAQAATVPPHRRPLDPSTPPFPRATVVGPPRRVRAGRPAIHPSLPLSRPQVGPVVPLLPTLLATDVAAGPTPLEAAAREGAPVAPVVASGVAARTGVRAFHQLVGTLFVDLSGSGPTSRTTTDTSRATATPAQGTRNPSNSRSS